jgi:hypothetical protein
MSLSRKIWLTFALVSGVLAFYLASVGQPEIGLCAGGFNVGCAVVGLWKNIQWT